MEKSKFSPGLSHHCHLPRALMGTPPSSVLISITPHTRGFNQVLPHAHSYPGGQRGPVLAGHPLPDPQPSPAMKALTSPLLASASSRSDKRTIHSLDCCDHTWPALSGSWHKLSTDSSSCVLGSPRGSRTSLALAGDSGRIVQRLNIALCSVVSQNRMEEGVGSLAAGWGGFWEA